MKISFALIGMFLCSLNFGDAYAAIKWGYDDSYLTTELSFAYKFSLSVIDKHSLELDNNKNLINYDKIHLSIGKQRAKSMSCILGTGKDYFSLNSIVDYRHSLTAYKQHASSGKNLLGNMFVGALFFGVGGWLIDKIDGGDSYNFGIWAGVGAGIGLIYTIFKKPSSAQSYSKRKPKYLYALAPKYVLVR